MRRRWTEGRDFAQVLSVRPDQATLIRQLLLKDPAFRDLCEDFLTVCDMIADFELKALSGERGVSGEYVRLRTELECDIARALLRSSEKARS